MFLAFLEHVGMFLAFPQHYDVIAAGTSSTAPVLCKMLLHSPLFSHTFKPSSAAAAVTEGSWCRQVQ
jgi:hypothetical protein